MSAHVLVVGAPPHWEDQIAGSLGRAGHHVEWVHTLRDQVDGTDVGVVVVCLTTSGSGRVDLTEFGVLGRAPLAGVPVVVLGADLDAETRLRIGIEGALDVVEIPFDPTELDDALTTVLAMDASRVATERRKVRAASLAALAHWERTGGMPDDDALTSERVRITRLERSGPSPTYPRHLGTARARAGRLTVKQRELLEALASGKAVSHVATDLGMSRSNVYTSLRRIGRRLGIDGTSELLGLAREGAFGGR